MHPIDFVITWVDPSDPKWKEDFKKYSSNPISADARLERYRDWGLLKYWFRGVDKYAPWVNKIHFITYGHIPEWLDVHHPKINIVYHEDYIQKELLPTFSSHPIELLMHRINGLAEHFVYFNDDFFVMNEINEEDYFLNGLPCDMAISNACSGGGLSAIIMNNLECLNNRYDKYHVIKNNFFKWFYPSYSFWNIRNVFLLPWSRFTGFFDHHLPQPYLKSSFLKSWDLYGMELFATCNSKFRQKSDVNHFLIRYTQLASGLFTPKNIGDYGDFCAVNQIDSNLLADKIKSFRKKILVINDGDVDDFFEYQSTISKAFEIKFNNKSKFEK